MFSFIKKLINKNKEDTSEFREAFINRIKDKKIKYLCERFSDENTGKAEDTVLAREGFFNINKKNELVIYCEGKQMFRAFIPDLKAYEFMSLEGVIFEGIDLDKNCFRQVIAYYKYHRK